MKQMTILITGAGPNGVTGKRIKEYFERHTEYRILTPPRKELDLTNFEEVNNYFHSNDIDYIVHCAVVAPSRNHDNSNPADEIESNLRMFLNLSYQTSIIKKIFYIGSGAEFDKRNSMKNIMEEDFPRSIPEDKYGFIKYVLQNIATNNPKIYNLRVFGTINPYEPSSRNVVSFICNKVAHGDEITLDQNCRFSFVDIDDLSSFINYGINNQLSYQDYNIIGATCEIKDLALIIRNFVFPKLEITFQKKGYNREYTGDNSRFLSEKIIPTDLEKSLKKVFDYWHNQSV